MADLTPKFSHQTRLTNCRGFYLRVTEERVEGSEDENDKFTTLEIISVARGGTAFRGESSNRYIGMDSLGNLVTYSSLTEDCVFNEHQNRNGYSSYESRSHAGWYLGLTKDGRAKPGHKTAPGQSAVEFSAENFDDHASWLLDHSRPVMFNTQNLLNAD